MKLCEIADCDKPARTQKAELCKMHYHRRYRHGSTEKVATGVPTGTPRLYRTLYRPGHPLANKYGNVYAHRYYLYEEIGPGPHQCHWCRTEVHWKPAAHPGSKPIQVDHLNGIKDDNQAHNIVPCCASCNSTRGQQDRQRLLREAGFWSNNDTIARLTTRHRKDVIG